MKTWVCPPAEGGGVEDAVACAEAGAVRISLFGHHSTTSACASGERR
jgi:hypothetical protein